MEDISGDDVGRQETQHNDSSPCKGTSPHFDGDLGQKRRRLNAVSNIKPGYRAN